jgi:hypothetical protein
MDLENNSPKNGDKKEDKVTIRVPKGTKAKYKARFYIEVAKDDPKLNIIYETLKRNAGVSLTVLEKQLKSTLNMNIRKSALRNYAKKWALPYTD